VRRCEGARVRPTVRECERATVRSCDLATVPFCKPAPVLTGDGMSLHVAYGYIAFRGTLPL